MQQGIQLLADITDRTPTILVVEDEFLIRAMLSDYLQECGFKVLEASSADEAVGIIENVDVVIDLVLTDIRMPGAMDGFGLAQWVRTNQPNMPVILASGLCENAILFQKPYDLEAVVGRIRSTLGASPLKDALRPER